MFECNDTIIDEELLLNDCMSKELKQQEYEEINFYDENFICKHFLKNIYSELLIFEGKKFR